MSGRRLRYPRALALLVAAAAISIATATFVLSGAGFSSASQAPNPRIVASPDWVPPTVVTTTVAKTVSGSPSGEDGYVRATGTYRVYAQVADLTSGVDAVTADVSSLTLGATATPMTAGSYTVGATTYNYASAELTVAGTTAQGTRGYAIRAVDNESNARVETTPTVLVDNAPPTAVQTDPGSPFRGRAKAFSAAVADGGGSGLDTERIQLAPAGTGAWTTICTLTAAPWSCTVDTTAFADGSYDVRSLVADNAGNVTASTVPARQLDNQHPGVVLVDPGAINGLVRLEASAEAGADDVDRVTFWLAPHDSGTWWPICIDGHDTATSSSYDCWLLSTLVFDGSYDLRAVATDEAGHTATSIVTQTIDNHGPGSVQMDNPGAQLRGTATLSGSAVDAGSGLDRLVFQVAPGTSESWSTACVATAPATTCAHDTTALDDGLYRFRMVAYDHAGNANASGAFGNVQVDNTGPAVTMTDPGPFLRGSPTLSATVTDGGVGVASVRYQRSPAGLGAWTDVCTATASPWSCAFPTATTGDGLYDLRARATDALGNVTVSDVVASRRVDNTPPANLALDDPGVIHGTVTLTAATPTDAGSGVASVAFQGAGSAAGPWITACSGTATSCVVDTTGLDGSAYLRITVTDNAGNVASSPVIGPRVIDNLPPTGTMVSPPAVLSGTVTLQANASDTGTGVALLRIQRSPAGAGTWTDVCSTSGASLSCAFNSSAVADGAYDFRMLASDGAGNTNTPSAGASTLFTGIVVDNAGPAVSVADPGPWLRGTVALTATASHAGAGVASVQIQRALHNSGTWTTICTDSSAPYTCSLNTTTLTNGASYDLRAIATDSATPAHTTTSAVVAERRVDNTAPTAVLDAVGSPLSGTVTLTGSGGMAGPGLGGDLRQRDAFEPVAADQLGLPGGEDAASDCAGQHQVRVPPGQVRGVALVVEVAAAGGPGGVGEGELLPGPAGGPAQPRRQRHLLQLVQVQGAHRGQEPGQDLRLQVRRVAAVGRGQGGDRAAQAGHGDPGQGHGPGGVAGAGTADQLGPHGIAGGRAGRRVQQQHPQLGDGHQPVRQPGGQPRGVQAQRPGAGRQQPERGVGSVQAASSGAGR